MSDNWLTVGRSQRVCQRIEVKSTSNCQRRHHLRRCNERVSHRIAVVTAGEVAIVRRHYCVCFTLLEVIPAHDKARTHETSQPQTTHTDRHTSTSHTDRHTCTDMHGLHRRVRPTASSTGTTIDKEQTLLHMAIPERDTVKVK